jgi:hypothetical protein
MIEWIFKKLRCPRRRKCNMNDDSLYEEMPPALSAPPALSEPSATPIPTVIAVPAEPAEPAETPTPSLPILPATPPSTPTIESPTDKTDTLSIIETLREVIVANNEQEEPTVLQLQIDYIITIIKHHLNSKNRKIRIPYVNNINLYITRDNVMSLSVVSFNALVMTCLSLLHVKLDTSNWTSKVTKKIVKITNNNYKKTFRSKFAKNSITIAMPKSFEEYNKLVTLESRH